MKHSFYVVAIVTLFVGFGLNGVPEVYTDKSKADEEYAKATFWNKIRYGGIREISYRAGFPVEKMEQSHSAKVESGKMKPQILKQTTKIVTTSKGGESNENNSIQNKQEQNLDNKNEEKPSPGDVVRTEDVEWGKGEVLKESHTFYDRGGLNQHRVFVGALTLGVLYCFSDYIKRGVDWGARGMFRNARRFRVWCSSLATEPAK